MLNHNKNKRTKQISNTILEEPSSASDLQCEQQNIASKAFPNIRINEKKIMTYNPLGQSNRNHSFNSTTRYQKNLNTSKEYGGKMGKSTSISNFKQVLQKINQSHSARIKTDLEKSNQLKRFLPNKTLTNDELKKAYSIQRQTNKPKYFLKSKNNYTNIEKPDQQSHILSKNKSFSKISSQLNESQNQQNEKIVDILTSMSKRQQNIADSKVIYEQKIKELKAKILSEKMQLAFSQKNYQITINSINQKEQCERQFTNQSLTSIKKRQNIEIQMKAIRGQIIDASISNNQVMTQIKEQKQLINNYSIVIQELKHQLKLETQEKLQIQKKLAILKKSQKIHALKKASQAQNTQDLIHTIYSSLNKWA